MMPMGDDISNRGASTLWIMLLTGASTATTLALACATPFTALAALAATRMHARDGMLLMLACWGASQIVGFCVLDYPRDARTMAWGVALGTGALAALGAARVAARFGRGPIVQLILAYLAASIGFKLVILLWSFGLGGVATALSPAINARQLIRNGAILVGLLGLYAGLVRLGVPALRRRQSAPARC